MPAVPFVSLLHSSKIIGLNEANETIVDKLAIHDKPDAFERVLEH